jgi:hypothetical protein
VSFVEKEVRLLNGFWRLTISYPEVREVVMNKVTYALFVFVVMTSVIMVITLDALKSFLLG